MYKTQTVFCNHHSGSMLNLKTNNDYNKWESAAHLIPALFWNIFRKKVQLQFIRNVYCQHEKIQY